MLKELLKFYLHATLECACSGAFHHSINCMAEIYLACLYYSTEQYQRAARYCLKVITTLAQSADIVSCIERQLLPQFDDNIERVLGIILLYQFVLKAALHQVPQTECSDVLSVDLLAHY